MPQTMISWKWEEAFDKFGFGDGDSWNGTDYVYAVIDSIDNLNTYVDTWGCHNYMVMDIVEADTDESILFEENGRGDAWLPHVVKRIKARGGDPTHPLGYLCPRMYLPELVIRKLDEALPDGKHIDGSTYF